MPELIIAIEIAGEGIYYPAAELYTLTELVPGKSYYVKVSESTSYTYPGCSAKSSYEFIPNLITKNNTVWNNVNQTGSFHSVIFDKNITTELQAGDYLGAFTSSGLCAGITEYQGSNTGLVIFSDDATTADSDGFSDAEYISYKLYRSETNKVFDISVTYNPEFNDGYFENLGISRINSLNLSTATMNSVIESSVSIYPNPSNGMFNITGVEEQSTIRLFNTFGEELHVNDLISNSTINLTNQPNGVYFIRINTNGTSVVKKLIKE